MKSDESLPKFRKKELEFKFTSKDFKGLFDIIQPSILVDNDGQVIDANASAVDLFRGRKEDMLGYNIYSLVKDITKGEPLLDFSVLPKGSRLKGETEVVRFNSQKLYLEYNVYAQALENFHLIMLRDLTKIKESEKRLAQNLHRFQHLVQNSSDIILVIGYHGRIKFSNNASIKIIGYEPEDILGKSFFNYVYEEDLNIIMKIYDDFINQRIKESKTELRLLNNQGQWVFVETVVTKLNLDENVFGLVVNIRDIQDRKLAEKQLLDTQGFMHQVTNSISNILYIYDLHTKRYAYLNHTAEKLLGYGVNYLKEYATLHFLDLAHPDDMLNLQRAERKLSSLKKDGVVHTEFRVQNKKGEWLWLSSRDQVSMRDINGQAWQILGTIENITERKNLEHKLAHDALHDELTGLPNRALFMRRLKELLESPVETDKNFAVLFLDLDRFKMINDSMGHRAGDMLLVNASKRLQSCLLRSDDLVCRLGGDEFTILLTDVNDIKDATDVAKEIQSKICKPFELEGRQVSISTSIGIALGSDSYSDPGQILRDADTAMYRAKHSGRSRYAVFDRLMHVSIVKAMQLEEDLRQAILNNQLEVYYQPIISLKTGLVRACEALLRWNHPTKGLVMPSEFIHLAEETSLINDLDIFVLREACRQNKVWQDMNLSPVTVSVNLSATQFKNKNLSQTVENVIQESGLNSRYLELEITESVVIENAEAAIRTLNEFKEMGIDLSIDDFGTGFSSLTYLKNLPIDAIKIDSSFVRDIQNSQETAAITSALILLAHEINLKVVAEGVENEQQLEFLRAHNCDRIQGYFYSMPVPASQIPAMLNTVGNYVFV